MYDETSPFDTVYGTVLSGSCELNSWVTHEFVGNTSIFSSSKLTKTLHIPNVLNFIMYNHHLST